MEINHVHKEVVILVVEDNPNDLELLLYYLKKLEFPCSFLHCDNLKDLLKILSEQKPDIIISDHDLPATTSKEVLKIVRKTNTDVPFIVVSGFLSEDGAVSLIGDDGVNDYVSKDNLQRLVHSVHRELKNHDIRNKLIVKEKELERSLKFLRAINDITTSLLDTDSLSDIVNTITDKLMNHFDFEDCVIYEFDKENHLLKQVAATGPNKKEGSTINSALTLKLGEGIVGSVAKSLKPEIVNDLTIDDRYIKGFESNKSEITVPILLDGELIGIIDSEHNEKCFYTDLHLQDIQTVAGVIATKFKAGQERERSKAATQELEKNELRLRQITQNIDAAVFRYILYPSGEGKIIYASGKIFDIYEISPKMILTNDNILWEQIIDNDREKVNQVYDDAIKNESSFTIEFRIQTPSGKIKWIETSGSITKQEDGSAISDSINKDITERIKTAKEVEQRESLLRTLTNNIPGIILRYSEDNEGNSDIEYISEGCSEIFEISQQQILDDNSKLWEMIFPEDIEAMLPAIQASVKTMTVWNFICRIKTKSGKVKYLHGNGTPRKNSDGNKIIWDTVTLDKTDEIIFEKELQESNERLLEAQELAKIGDWSIDMTTGITYISPEIKKIYGIDADQDLETKDGVNFYKEGYDRDRIEFVLDQAINNGKSYDEELILVTVKDNERWVRVSGESTFKDGKCVRLNGILMDISEQRKLRSALEVSLKEKTILLAEIHHRVKNNLAIITGLIDLQSMDSEDENLKNLLGDTTLRIKSIANVHEMLYNTDSFSDVSFDEYIRKLIDSIKSSISDKNGEINIDIEKNLKININQAIPMGLLLNELITNSFKYAFSSDSTHNYINFALTFNKGYYQATYSDSGKGFNQKKLKKGSSLGALLIDTLLKQLNAEYSIKTENGFKGSFKFSSVILGPHSNI